MMNDAHYDIGILYQEDCFNKVEIETIQNLAHENHIDLLARAKPRICYACLDIFWPVIEVFLSPNMLLTLMQSIGTNAIYDTFKALGTVLYKKFHSTPLTKIQSGKCVQQPANIQFVVGNSRLVLPIDVDFEKYQYAVDSFFEKTISCEEEQAQYYIFSEKECILQKKTREQIVREEYVEYCKSKEKAEK